MSAELDAARRARTWVRDRLDGWSDEGSDAVRLLVSELVTNAVLHSGSGIGLALYRSGAEVTVEVSDESPTLPVVKSYGADASTGRGMHLIDMLSSDWGVREGPERKAVWFSYVDGDAAPAGQAWTDDPPSDGDSPAADPPAAEAPAAEAPAADAPAAEAQGPPAASPETLIRLVGLPLSVYLAAEEHNDALMREFALISQDYSTEGIPKRLLELAAELRNRFVGAAQALRLQVEKAMDAGDETLDLELALPREGGAAVSTLVAQLDEADRFCEQENMLTLAAPPVVRGFRWWFAQEVVIQIEGKAPTPWPYPRSAG